MSNPNPWPPSKMLATFEDGQGFIEGGQTRELDTFGRPHAVAGPRRQTADAAIVSPTRSRSSIYGALGAPIADAEGFDGSARLVAIV